MEFNHTLNVPSPLIADSLRAVLSTILFHRMLGSVTPSSRESHLGVAYPVILGEAGASLDALVEEKASLAARALDAGTSGKGPTATTAKAVVVSVRFLHKSPTPRKAGWFGSRATTEPSGDTAWEKWNVLVQASPSLRRGSNHASPVVAAVASESLQRPESRRNSTASNASSLSHATTVGIPPETLVAASDHLQSMLLKITTEAHKNTAHIPSITTTQVASFAYDIVVYPSDLAGKPIKSEDSTGEDESWGNMFKKILDS